MRLVTLFFIVLITAAMLPAQHIQAVRSDSVRSDSGSNGTRNADDAALFEYTLGGLPPTPISYDIYSTGWTQFSLSLPPAVEPWIDASLTSYTTPSILKIGIKPGKVPPPGAYTTVVYVNSAQFALDFPVILIVRAATGAASGSVVLPQLACGAGWSTTVYFTNAVDTSRTATFTIHDNAGVLMPIGSGSSRSVSLSPDGTESVSFSPADCPTLREGFLKLTLPDGVFASAVFQQTEAGTQPQEAVVTASASLTSTAIPFDDTGNFVTALALLCTKAASGQTGDFIELTAHDRNGTVLGTATVPLQKDAKTTIVLRERIPAVIGKLGALKIKATSGAFSALGLRFNGRAFTSIPVK